MRIAAAMAGLLVLCMDASAQEPRWSYGQHAELGLSAHVDLPNGAHVGLVCGRRGGPAVRMVFSAGFFPAEYRRRNPASPVPDMAPFTVSYAFAGARSHGGEMLTRAPRGAFQRLGTSCDVDIEALRVARAMWFFDQDDYHPAARAEAPEGDPPLDIAERIARRAPVRVTLPLAGAREAIDRLIAACRPLADATSAASEAPRARSNGPAPPEPLRRMTCPDRPGAGRRSRDGVCGNFEPTHCDGIAGPRRTSFVPDGSSALITGRATGCAMDARAFPEGGAACIRLPARWSPPRAASAFPIS